MGRKRNRKFFLLWFFSLIQGIFFLSSSYIHGKEWYEVEWGNHRIYFPDSATEYGEKIVQSLSLLPELSRWYFYSPTGYTIWVLYPEKVEFNGLAFYPFRKVEVWGEVSPFLYRGYTPWVSNVVVHEFTHLATLPLATFFPRYVGGVLGGGEGVFRNRKGSFGGVLYIPMDGVPRWFSEGIAQYEAERVGVDRWDSVRRTWERVAIVEKKIFTPEEMGDLSGRGVYTGEQVYNQGFSFVRFLGEEYGRESLLRVLQEAGSSPFSSWERVVRKVYGKDLSTLFKEWRERKEREYEKDITLPLAGLPVSSGTISFLLSPRPLSFTEGSWIAIGEKDPDFPSGSLYLFYPEKGTSQVLMQGVDTFTVHPAGSTIFATVYRSPWGKDRLDIYAYDLSSKKGRILTSSYPSPRYRSLAIDRSGKYLYSGKIEKGGIHLVRFPLNEETMELGGEEVLLSLPWGWEVREIVSSGDGEIWLTVAYNGEMDLVRYNQNGTAEVLDLPGSHEHSPLVVGDHLWFVSDRTGKWEVYSYSLSSQTLDQRTVTPFGVWDIGTVSDSTLYGTVPKYMGLSLYALSTTSISQGSFPLRSFSFPSSSFRSDLFAPKPSKFRLLSPLFYPELLYTNRSFTAGTILYLSDERGIHEWEGEVLLGAFSYLYGGYMYTGFGIPWKTEGSYSLFKTLLPVQGVPEGVVLPLSYTFLQTYSEFPFLEGMILTPRLHWDRFSGSFMQQSQNLLTGKGGSLSWTLLVPEPHTLFSLDPRGTWVDFTVGTRRSFSLREETGEGRIVTYPHFTFQGIQTFSSDLSTWEVHILFAWIGKDVSPLEEFYLGGQVFSIRRGEVRSFVSMPGYEEFSIRGEKLFFLKLAHRRTLTSKKFTILTLPFSGLVWEVRGDLGQGFPHRFSFQEVFRRIGKKGRLDPLDPQGLLPDLATDLRTQLYLFPAVPLTTFFRVAYGFLDPHRKTGFPLRIAFGVGVNIP